jgi:uncharacterized protein
VAGPSPAPSEQDRLPPMARYVMGLLRRPPSPPPTGPGEAERLQEAHLAHLRRLLESHELLACGPFLEETALRGALLFRTDSIDAARRSMTTDPLVASGRLLLELYTWYAPAALGGPGPPSPSTELTFESD